VEGKNGASRAKMRGTKRVGSVGSVGLEEVAELPGVRGTVGRGEEVAPREIVRHGRHGRSQRGAWLLVESSRVREKQGGRQVINLQAPLFS
jgi:hypothetical protein